MTTTIASFNIFSRIGDKVWLDRGQFLVLGPFPYAQCMTRYPSASL